MEVTDVSKLAKPFPEDFFAGVFENLKWPWVKTQIVPPVNIPMPAKIGSKKGWCTYPKMVPLALTSTAKCAGSLMFQHWQFVDSNVQGSAIVEESCDLVSQQVRNWQRPRQHPNPGLFPKSQSLRSGRTSFNQSCNKDPDMGLEARLQETPPKQNMLQSWVEAHLNRKANSLHAQTLPAVTTKWQRLHEVPVFQGFLHVHVSEQPKPKAVLTKQTPRRRKGRVRRRRASHGQTCPKQKQQKKKRGCTALH